VVTVAGVGLFVVVFFDVCAESEKTLATQAMISNRRTAVLM